MDVRAAGAAAADAQLDATLAAALAALAPPGDWGRDPTVPHLLQRYLQLSDEVYGMVERGTVGAKAYDRSEMAKLQAQVEALTDAQRLELAPPPRISSPRSPIRTFWTSSPRSEC